MSAVYRAPIFFLTTLKAGWRQALGAMLIETSFRALTSGFYGAITQALRKMEPPWLAILIIVVLAPAVVQVLEAGVHWIRGTPNLAAGIVVSTIVTAIGSLFNWYAMRKGTFLTGDEGESLLADLKNLPRVIFGFLRDPIVGAWNWIAGPRGKS